MCWKTIEIEDVFTKTEMNNEWNVNFLQNSPLGIQHICYIQHPFMGYSRSKILAYNGSFPFKAERKSCFSVTNLYRTLNHRNKLTCITVLSIYIYTFINKIVQRHIMSKTGFKKSDAGYQQNFSVGEFAGSSRGETERSYCIETTYVHHESLFVFYLFLHLTKDV